MALLKNFFILFFLLTGTFSSCQPSENSRQNQEIGAFKGQNEGDFKESNTKKHRKRHKRDRNDVKTQNMPLRIEQVEINQTLARGMCLKRL